MKRLEARVAIVTGAAGGIGQATVRRLAADGALVVATDIDVHRVRDAFGPEQTPALALRLDVTNEDEWRHVRDEVRRHFGTLDILVNNVGATNGVGLEDTTLEDWHKIFNVNLTGAFLGMKTLAEHLKASSAASVINVSSIFGARGVGKSVAYSAAKAGIHAMTQVMAVQWAPEGVRVNTVSPGLVDTPFHGAAREAAVQRWAPSIPLGRFGRADELAAAIAYLASDDASYVTGTDFRVDGGFLAR